MSGKLMLQRKREQHKIDHQARLTRNTDKVFSVGISPKQAFHTLVRRVNWLNDKIAWCQANELKFGLYVQEREALLWIMDKVKELSERLLEYESRSTR